MVAANHIQTIDGSLLRGITDRPGRFDEDGSGVAYEG
jgi:hypothetical protein